MKYLHSSILLLFVLCFNLATPSEAGQHRIIRVVDGDTIVVNYVGKYEKLRFLCVNTPESVHPDVKQNIPIGNLKYLIEYRNDNQGFPVYYYVQEMASDQRF